MRITIESTATVVSFDVEGMSIPARIWQGETDSGIPVHVFVTRLAPEIPPDDPRQEQFQLELEERAAPRETVRAIPLRLIL